MRLVCLILLACFFQLAHGQDYVPLDFPGSTSTRVLGVNLSGTVSGTFTASNGRNYGFTLNPQGFFEPLILMIRSIPVQWE